MNTLAYKLSPQQKTIIQTAADNAQYSQLQFSVNGSIVDIEEKLTLILNSYSSFKFEFVTDPMDNTILQSVGDTLRVQYIYNEVVTNVPQLFNPLLPFTPLLKVYINELNDNLELTLIAHPVCADLSGLLLLKNQLTGQQQITEDISYIQFAEWQSQLLAEDSALEGINFWQQQPTFIPCRLRLEGGYADTETNVLTITLATPLATAIIQQAANQDITTETILLSGFFNLIKPLSVTDDYTIGLECHGREFDELNGTMGLLSKVVPFNTSTNVTADLKTIHDQIETTRYYQFYYSQQQTTGFDYQFGYLNTPVHSFTDALQLLLPAKLKCQVVQSGNQISVSLIYNNRFLTQTDAGYLAEAFIANLEHIAAYSQNAVDQLAQQYAVKFAAPLTALPVSSTIVDDIQSRFKYLAHLYPDQIAVKTQTSAYTYKEVDSLTDKVAANLQTNHHIKSNDFIGVVMEEDPWLPITMLAVLKAGAAYIPIDTTNPQARINHILTDSAPVCVITTTALAGSITGNNTPVLLITDLLQDNAVIPVLPKRSGEQVAYMIYTSGTTGVPKGVMITDANLINYTDWLKQTFDITTADQSILQASYAYDLGYTSLWGCLLNGATLHIVPADQRQNTDWLVNYINEQNISFLKLTPSVFYLLLNAENVSQLKDSHLRLIICGGEKIDTSSLQQFEAIKSNVVFVNHYGPTETTIGAIYHSIKPTQLNNFIAKPVIGRPISNMVAFILDDSNQPCLPGQTGQICIGGKGVSKGYHNRSELNQHKFFNYTYDHNDIILYRTGDLAYRLTDGNICIEGRVDDQVKVRGHRIELSEINQALTQSGLDKHLLTLIKAPGYGDELVCYYQAATDADVLLLRNRLLQYIPDYMVPAFFVRMVSLPLTANGKADYKALPNPYEQVVQATQADVAMNNTEKLIADIWQIVLHRTNITPQSDFFLLGGDSIKAIQIIAQINRKGLKCQLADIFNFTTIATLANHLQPQYPANVTETEVSPATDENLINYNLSPMQQAMYFHYQAFPQSKANIIIRQFEVEGKMDITNFKQAVSEAFAHYDILRIKFITDVSGTPVLQIRNKVTQTSTTQTTTPDELAGAIQTTRKQWLNDGFDMAADLLLRIKLLECTNGNNVILLAYHHIIMDGWCFNIISKGILSCYYSLCNNVSYEWPPYTLFTSYLEWLKQRPEPNSVDFWTNYLYDFNTITPLPSPLPAPLSDEYQPALTTLALDSQLTEAITELCRDKKTTLNVFFQAAWGILLNKYNNTFDSVFGITVAGRPYELDGFENMIGLFINTIPLRVQINEQTTTSNLLTGLTTFLHQYQAHQYMPLPEVQACSTLNKHLIDHLLVFENYPLASVQQESEGLDINITSSNTFGHTSYPLAVVIYPGEQVHISFAFNKNVYPEHWMQKVSSHLLQVITQMVNNPQLLVTDIEIVSSAERQTLLALSHSPGSFDPKKTIVNYFDEACSRFTNKVAIEHDNLSLTYGELQQSARQLASWLINQHDVKPGDKVGIYLSPSLNIPLAIWGILYCGAAYVPMDVEHPADRISFITQDSQCKLIITAQQFAGNLGEISATPLLVIENMSTSLPKETNLPVAEQSNLAYIIYTSGSTGRPKGCLISHLNLMNLFEQKTEWLSFNSDDVWIMAHSYAFDFSVWEHFGAVLNGGRLYIPHRDEVRDIEGFRNIIKTHGVTILNQTPAAFYLLLDNMVTAEYDLTSTKLRMVMFGGDKLDFYKLKPWLNLPGSNSIKLYNLFGITEITVHASWHYVSTAEIERAGKQSVIGRAIPGTSIYVLNNQLQLCPVGITGELVVSGNGVTMGYHNRADLTSQKFIADNYNPGNYMYRSGDYGRWLADGTLEYLNRKDDQIQIRGFRVEPGEVTHHLLQHPQINEAFVLARQVSGTDIELIAYIVSVNSPTVKQIKGYLADRLPSHFIPTHFVFLDQLPLTFNGKINKEKLPAPSIQTGQGHDHNQDLDIIEQTLLSIWQKELNLNTIGLDDDFFDLGGHSLKAVRLMSEVQKQFEIVLPVVQLYKNGTINGLAAVIRAGLQNAYDIVESDHILLKAGNPAQTLFFFPPAVGYAIGFASLARHLHNCTVHGINFIEQDTLQAMANYVQTLQPEGDIVLCGFSAGGSICFHVTKILEAAGRNVAAIIMLDSRRFMEAEPLTDSEIVSIADEYLANPIAQDYITSPVMKIAMRKRIEGSTRFIHSLKDDGLIHADIYYISSETNRDNHKRIMAWQPLTTGFVFEYSGYGPHVSMLNEPYMADNLIIYQNIIDHIWADH